MNSLFPIHCPWLQAYPAKGEACRAKAASQASQPTCQSEGNGCKGKGQIGAWQSQVSVKQGAQDERFELIIQSKNRKA